MSRINNSFRLTGHLGADPETRYLPTSGEPVVRLSLAVNHAYRHKDTGEKVERTDWFDLTVYFRGLVDVAQQYVRKGSQIQVRGHLRKRVWDSKDRKDDSGAPLKESRIEFVVTEIMLLARPKAGTDDESASDSSYTAGEDSDPIEDEAELPF